MIWFSRKTDAKQCQTIPSDNRGLGAWGEKHAAEYLTTLRYRILEFNFRCKGGEVDIVAQDPRDNTLVFVEVKTRRGTTYGAPQLAVTPFKQRQISKAALSWMLHHKKQYDNGRFDVIAILLDDSGQHKVEHIVNAFELAY